MIADSLDIFFNVIIELPPAKDELGCADLCGCLLSVRALPYRILEGWSQVHLRIPDAFEMLG